MLVVPAARGDQYTAAVGAGRPLRDTHGCMKRQVGVAAILLAGVGYVHVCVFFSKLLSALRSTVVALWLTWMAMASGLIPLPSPLTHAPLLSSELAWVANTST